MSSTRTSTMSTWQTTLSRRPVSHRLPYTPSRPSIPCTMLRGDTRSLSRSRDSILPLSHRLHRRLLIVSPTNLSSMFLRPIRMSHRRHSHLLCMVSPMSIVHGIYRIRTNHRLSTQATTTGIPLTIPPEDSSRSQCSTRVSRIRPPTTISRRL